MMHNKYDLYIGSNNITHKVEEKKIRNILNKNIEGYTLIKSEGFWNGIKENSVITEIISNKDITTELKQLVNTLKIELKQQSILFTKSLIDVEFI